jgi:hypothetical protein
VGCVRVSRYSDTDLYGARCAQAHGARAHVSASERSLRGYWQHRRVALAAHRRVELAAHRRVALAAHRRVALASRVAPDIVPLGCALRISSPCGGSGGRARGPRVHRGRRGRRLQLHTSAHVSTRQHTSAYVSRRRARTRRAAA